MMRFPAGQERELVSRAEVRSGLRPFHVLGVRVDAVQIPEVVAQMENWIQTRGGPHFIAVTGMHGVTEAQRDATFKSILRSASLVVPDGMPLVWLARMQRRPLRRRVYGPELMATFCEQTAGRYRHFFYGGAPGVADALGAKFARRYGILVAGTFTPPFRPLTREESEGVALRINASAADIVWVGLNTPKQERWMFEHGPKLNASVLVGVGAAFDFHTGRIAQAPVWMRENGLEWLFRLTQDPRRLWRRYILGGIQFCTLVLLEILRLKKFRQPAPAAIGSENTRTPQPIEVTQVGQVAEEGGDKVE